MTRPELLQDKKKLEAYLYDRKLNLPEILFESDKTVKTAIKEIAALDKQLAELDAQDEIKKAEERQALDDSMKLLTEVKDILYRTGEELDGMWSQLHHTHRALALEFKNMIAQSLRGYTPAKKDKDKK